MTKEDFLNWLSQFKFISHYRKMITDQHFTEAELDWLQKSLQPKLKIRKELLRSRGA